MPGQRRTQRVAHRPGRRPRHHRRAHHEPGVVIDPGHHLHLGAVGQEHPAHHVHLPQLHRPAPLPPPVVRPPAAALGRLDQPVAHQRPIHRRPARQRRPPRPAPAGSGSAPDPTPDAPGAAPRSAPPPPPASDADTTPAATTGPPDSPAHPRAAYRRSHSCTVCRATPYRRATSVTAAPSRTSSTARYRCSTTPSSTSITGPLRGDHETTEGTAPTPAGNTKPEVSPTYRNRCRPATGTASANCHPGAGTNVSTIYRDSHRPPESERTRNGPTRCTAGRAGSPFPQVRAEPARGLEPRTARLQDPKWGCRPGVADAASRVNLQVRGGIGARAVSVRTATCRVIQAHP